MHKMLEVKKKWREMVTAAMMSRILMHGDPQKGNFCISRIGILFGQMSLSI